MQVSAIDATSYTAVSLKRSASAPLPQTESAIAVDTISARSQTPSAHRCTEPGCTRRFNRKYTLVEHMKTHTGEKPHVCPVKTCGKRFSTSGNLSRHKRLHGYIEPLECPVDGCLSSFPSNSKLEKHMKFHLGSAVQVCTINHCGKTFSTTGNLNRHVKHQHAGVSSGELSPSQLGASSPTSAEQQSAASYTSLLLDSSVEVAHPPAIDVSSLTQFQGVDNSQVVPTSSKIATTWHSDEMVDVLTEIFDEAATQPESVKQLETTTISILDDMIKFHLFGC
ncbi:hypothetical protein PHYBOEH_002764 [Phytophthora boehmeriae]|uniref:C2H2-type domain-containing protein n=1 Tax=Phytophthora boehmeriae TaxID=109152 RepID=A0A8T1WWC3_9STRA|nr:hypothetical protein PHYBOEH_002764 [Phytophthora boehmeriae]